MDGPLRLFPGCSSLKHSLVLQSLKLRKQNMRRKLQRLTWILSHGEKGVFSQTTLKCKESETRVQDPTGFSARPRNSSAALTVSSHVAALPVAWLSDFLDSNPPFCLSWRELSFCCLQTKYYVCTCVKKTKRGGSSPHMWPTGAPTTCSGRLLVKGRGNV